MIGRKSGCLWLGGVKRLRVASSDKLATATIASRGSHTSTGAALAS
jgi:hypothetical protein